MIDHDRHFKELIGTFFREFLELFAPEVASRVQWESLRFLDKEIFADLAEGQRHPPKGHPPTSSRWRHGVTRKLVF